MDSDFYGNGSLYFGLPRALKRVLGRGEKNIIYDGVDHGVFMGTYVIEVYNWWTSKMVSAQGGKPVDGAIRLPVIVKTLSDAPPIGRCFSKPMIYLFLFWTDRIPRPMQLSKVIDMKSNDKKMCDRKISSLFVLN